MVKNIFGQEKEEDKQVEPQELSESLKEELFEVFRDKKEKAQIAKGDVRNLYTPPFTSTSQYFKGVDIEDLVGNTKPWRMSQLQEALFLCKLCPLRKSCKGQVTWWGDPDSPIMVVGEAPGGVEDDYGIPLVGKSGQLFDKALFAAGITRDKILVTNMVKCRPKNNRTPTPSEAKFCAELWLEKEMAVQRPKVIIALGNVALKFLGKPKWGITSHRGQWFSTPQGYECIATYHPSYLLRLNGKQQNAAKWDVLHDLQAAKEKAEIKKPGYSLMNKEGKMVDFSKYLENKRDY
jgi:DNA polymerase